MWRWHNCPILVSRLLQIYYWDPLFRYCTEARARASLDLMKVDVKDRHVVQVFCAEVVRESCGFAVHEDS